MPDDFVLDAHAIVWYLEGNPRLGARAKAIIDTRDNAFVLPAIALAEAAYVVEHRRSAIPSVQELFERVEADRRIRVAPLTIETVKESSRLLSIPEMHDRLIVATARLIQARGQSIVLVTKDETITGSGLIPVTW